MNKKQQILQIMNEMDIPTYLIEEYIEADILPNKRNTIDIVSKVIKKIKNIDNDRVICICDDNDLIKINDLYSKLYLKKLL